MFKEHKWKLISFGGGLLFTLLLYAGCGQKGNPTAPNPVSSQLKIVTLKQDESSSSNTTSVRICAAEGGEVELNGNRLEIPPGALPADTTITMICPNPDKAMVQLKPNRLVFLRSVLLTLSYAEAEDLDEEAQLSIYWQNPDNQEWEWMGGRDDKVKEEVTTQIGHFSRYALAESY